MGRTRKITLAPNALTTLEDMKTMLGIDPADTASDPIIINLINSVSSWIQRMTGRNLLKQSYVQLYDAAGTQELVLLQWPIIAVDYVKNTEDGYIIPATEYHFGEDDQIGVLYKDNGWPLRGYRGGLAYDITAYKRCLEVSYTAGYVMPRCYNGPPDQPLPDDLQGVVWDAVMQKFAIMQNGAQGLSAFSISDVSWTFDKNPQQSWLDIIGYYTRL